MNYRGQQVRQYVADNIITRGEADGMDSEVSTAMENDAAETEDEQEGLFDKKHANYDTRPLRIFI
ncbi:MAG: hypothetical protein QW478_13470 [Candidatus Micrarchaeaceae archaeon]